MSPYTDYDKEGMPELEGLLTAVVVVCISLVAVCLWQLAKLRRRFADALTGSDGSLEQILKSHLKKVEVVDAKLHSLNATYYKLSEMAGLASQKISVVRFNPFGDTGGDQSFALAVLDSHDSGYILTSIHGREGTRVYVKPIDFGKSKYGLSEEEHKALEQASQRVPRN